MSAIECLVTTPAYCRWSSEVQNLGESGWRDYQSYIMRIDHMLASLEVLWPEFIIRDSLLLRKSGIPDNWQKFLAEASNVNWSTTEIEYLINHLHIGDCFPNDADRDHMDISVYQFLAKTIAEMWHYRLENLFPDRKFKVILGNMDSDPEVSVITVT